MGLFVLLVPAVLITGRMLLIHYGFAGLLNRAGVYQVLDVGGIAAAILVLMVFMCSCLILWESRI